jgi:hypothetical protein
MEFCITKKRAYIEPGRHPLFADIPPLVRVLKKNKKGNFNKIALNGVRCPGLEQYYNYNNMIYSYLQVKYIMSVTIE